jgi:hypothetical protein
MTLRDLPPCTALYEDIVHAVGPTNSLVIAQLHSLFNKIPTTFATMYPFRVRDVSLFVSFVNLVTLFLRRSEKQLSFPGARMRYAPVEPCEPGKRYVNRYSSHYRGDFYPLYDLSSEEYYTIKFPSPILFHGSPQAKFTKQQDPRLLRPLIPLDRLLWDLHPHPPPFRHHIPLGNTSSVDDR